MSMKIANTFKDWHEWAQVDLSDLEIAARVLGGLVPVLVNRENRIGVYVELNVLINHDVKPGGGG